MNRRTFMEAIGALAGGALVGGVARARRDATAAAAHPAARGLDAAAFRAARRYAQTRFGKVAYLDRGAGDAVLFLHGFPLNGFQWRGAIDRLASQRRCIAPDFLGLGYTEVAAGQSVAPDAQVQMLAALLDGLGVKTVDVIANDSGGAVAQLFVTRQRQRVRTLLITNCDVENDSPPPAMLPVIALAHAGTYPDKWLVPWVADKKLARSPAGLGGMTFTFPTHPTDEAIDMYLGPLVSSPARKALTCAYALGLEHNPLAGLEPALKGCTVPTRIVWGMGDTIFKTASADYLDHTLPRSRGVRRLAGAKLFWPEEYPDVIVEEAQRLWV